MNKPISGIFFAGFFNCLSEEKSLASHLESMNHTAARAPQTTPNCEYFSPNCAHRLAALWLRRNTIKNAA